MRDRKLVVAGLIVGADGRILITQRRADQALPLQWEFPGGKVEPGEAPVAALARELREEIGVGVTVGRVWDVLFHAYPAFDLVMLVYSCRILDGEVPQSVEVADLAWVPPGELPGWDILPADRPLVDRLIAEGSPDLIPSRGGAYNSPDMEGRAKVTKEVLCEEARFILANVMAEARYGRQNRYDDIRRVCEGAVSIPFSEYIGFLEKSGYLRHDRANESLEVTPEGETVVNGGNLAEFTERAVSHFKKLRQSRAMAVPAAAVPMGTQSGAMSSSAQPMVRSEASGANPLPRKEPKPMTTSGGRPSAMAGGEIMSAGDMDNRYEKLVTIGSGGMGTVYRARQVALNREVALKEIRDLFGFFSEDQRNEIVRRFTDVVRAWGNLAHPNILPIHDVNLYSEYPNLITELAPNGSCRRLINDAEEIPVELVFKYLLQTLHALRAGHAQRVYHRGLKPEQLLIDGYGNVKVSDFGFTRIVERDHAVIRQIYVGMGNVAYMAPELYSDPMMSGPQTDIYALGIIFYELLTRKLPGRRSPMPSQLNPTLPKGIDDIFDQMTRDARNERYATVDDILDDIDKLEGMESVLGSGDRVLVGDSPLSNIKFRPGAEEPLAGTPIEEGGDGDDKGSSRRPYSFQQRRNKKI